MTDKPVAQLEAILAHYSKKMNKGENKIYVSFILNPEDLTPEFEALKLGEIVKLFVTLPDLGV